MIYPDVQSVQAVAMQLLQYWYIRLQDLQIYALLFSDGNTALSKMLTYPLLQLETHILLCREYEVVQSKQIEEFKQFMQFEEHC
jgi:hypothetical protein